MDEGIGAFFFIDLITAFGSIRSFFCFNHLMQIAYKILSHCIYKCNVHLVLVVEIWGTFYNV